MYRLILYFLAGLLIVAFIFDLFHILPQNPWHLLFTTLFLIFFGSFINEVFSKIFHAPTNIESTYITALILALIISPAVLPGDFIFLAWASILANGSKYILAIGKKHLFNPVAIAITLTAIGIHQSASWWVGTSTLIPFVLVGGYLIVRKIRREKMVICFLITTVGITILDSLIKGSNILFLLNSMFFHSPLLFVAFVILTEPLTTPSTNIRQILYGIIVGILYVPDVHIGSIYSTPELAVVIGNVFSYIISPKEKLILKLQEKIAVAGDTWDFLFPLEKKLSFIPGQYMEWTLPHASPDSRGNRRYFTIASSPTEDVLRLGVKFYASPSSYKKTLLNPAQPSTIVGSQRAGDFLLPKSTTQKLVFLAGGIGITPFRSMLKWCIDMKQYRDIILLYSNKNIDEICYRDILDQAREVLQTNVMYTLTDIDRIPANWTGGKGRVDKTMIQKHIPDYMERLFYLSGPQAMVTAYKTVLHTLNVPHDHIKTDYFPGFA